MQLPDITYNEDIDSNLRYLLDELRRAIKKGTYEERQEFIGALQDYLRSKNKIKTPLGWISQEKWNYLNTNKLVRVSGNTIQISNKKVTVLTNNNGEITETQEFEVKQYLD